MSAYVKRDSVNNQPVHPFFYVLPLALCARAEKTCANIIPSVRIMWYNRKMKLFLNHTYKYAIEQVLLTLFPGERPEYPEGRPEGDCCVSRLHQGKQLCASCKLSLGGSCFTATARAAPAEDKLELERRLQRLVKLSFYRAALKAGVEKPVWGALTGIRPAKLLSRLLDEGLSEGAAVTRFCREFDVTRERAMLCLDAARFGRSERARLSERDICLYIGIPFCPTRCAYCSFVSQSVEKSMGLIPAFLEALYREIAAVAAIVRRCGLRPVALYFGGGTPTTLSAGQLDELCSRLESAFDLSSMREFTVEAGRPDTITSEKLAVLRAHRVTRLSVNPQTMQDGVLEAIGRRHTSADIVSAVSLVRESGGFELNMDLIAGLPTDTAAGFTESLNKVLSLKPENITVHNLALKKGSRITLGENGERLPPAAEVGKMLDAANAGLVNSGYLPYYLYRQKFMSGGFENIGWCLPGSENEYNICIMEELCSVISLGGGASTKLVAPGGRIERIFDPKYPREFIELIDKTISAKNKIEVFYNGI